ncbi:hypothetical protein ACWC3X_43460 [Streptomyces populi]
MATITVAAGGAILAMIAEAYSRVHLLTRLVTVVGFLSASALAHPREMGPGRTKSCF